MALCSANVPRGWRPLLLYFAAQNTITPQSVTFLNSRRLDAQGNSTVQPVVERASRLSCALRTSASANRWSMRIFT